MRKVYLAVLTLIILTVIAGCGTKKSAETEVKSEVKTLKKVVIGATPVPHAEILEKAKEELAKRGIELEIKIFTDYVTPNLSLQDKSLDANYFQHQPYLDDFNKEKGTDLISIAAVHYEPMGIYSKKIKTVSELKEGDEIAVPNDTTNEARALILLQDNGIIVLKDPSNLKSTLKDIKEYKVKVKIKEVEAAQISRAIDGIAAAVINGNYAIDAGLNPSKDALASEKSSSIAAKTYANILVVKKGEENREELKTVAEVLKSEEIKKFINEKYKGAVVPSE